MASGNIDALLDQMDNDIPNNCCVCLSIIENLLILSCGHHTCLKCADILINSNKTINCPTCQIQLTINIKKLLASALLDPLKKLNFYHNISIGDILWGYRGSGHNWLYSKENCDIIENAYQQFENTSDNDEHGDESDDENSDENGENDGINKNTVEIIINMNGSNKIYVINFDKQIQYPKNTPHYKRKIFTFTLKSKRDLEKNKIIGVAGQLL